MLSSPAAARSTLGSGPIRRALAVTLSSPTPTPATSTSPSPLYVSVRHRVNNSSILSNIRQMADEDGAASTLGDASNKLAYIRRRQQDAIAFAVKEKEYLSDKARRQLDKEEEQAKVEHQKAALIAEAGKLGGPEAEEKMRRTLAEAEARYVKSVDAFGDKTVRLQHSFSGLADNRIIQWWEHAYWNYVRYFFTHELLIAKDRFGNRFTVTWQFVKGREEQRRMYRLDANKKHQPYGSLATDERLWERWMRGHRGDPPSVAEEEHNRDYKRQFFGAMVLEDEEVEDALMRLLAHMNRSQATFQELDADQAYGDVHTATRPMRETERKPGQEIKAKGQKGATWTLGFVRGDLFYNEEEVQVMRNELSHVFRNMEWQNLEYKRQVRMNKAQPPRGKPAEGSTDPNDPDGIPMHHYWQRTDMDIPYHDAVSDLTTPELERMRIESDQLEDERLALRKELGLTDLGDMREGRDPVVKGHDPFGVPPTSTRWKPKCWEESWGTGGGMM